VRKTHERCCQGRGASSCSQRQIVEADASVTPRSITKSVKLSAAEVAQER
jgi:hypothetical protein